MKLLVLTYGTEGDTRPLAALCRALAGAGHAVTLLADGSTLEDAPLPGVRCEALPGDIRARLAGEGGPRDINRALLRIVDAQSPAWLRRALAAGVGCDAVIASGLAAFVGLSAAEALAVPCIGTLLIPITPTAEFGAPLLPFALPRALNRGSHRLLNSLTWRMMRDATNRARAQAGLAARTALWDGHPMLYGISPALLPRPADWPGNAHLTGQWLAPGSHWTPPPPLQAFLDGGPPPLYVGFGSMAGLDGDGQRLRAVVEAVGARRALVQPGWSRIDADRLPENFHVVDAAPHDRLFPRVSLAIHHGGSGTTHSACRAGIPSVIVPFAGDQPFWARRLRAAGIAADALPAKCPGVDRLAAAIAFAEGDAARSRAAALGARMRAEDGCADAVRILEALLAAPHAAMG